MSCVLICCYCYDETLRKSNFWRTGYTSQHISSYQLTPENCQGQNQSEAGSWRHELKHKLCRSATSCPDLISLSVSVIAHGWHHPGVLGAINSIVKTIFCRLSYTMGQSVVSVFQLRSLFSPNSSVSHFSIALVKHQD